MLWSQQTFIVKPPKKFLSDNFLTLTGKRSLVSLSLFSFVTSQDIKQVDLHFPCPNLSPYTNIITVHFLCPRQCIKCLSIVNPIRYNLYTLTYRIYKNSSLK